MLEADRDNRNNYYEILNSTINHTAPVNQALEIMACHTALKIYIKTLLPKPPSTPTQFLKNPFEPNTPPNRESKLSAALWFQAILIGDANYERVDFEKHFPVLKLGKLNNIVKNTALFKLLSKPPTPPELRLSNSFN